mgnify:CR=1 FL=1
MKTKILKSILVLLTCTCMLPAFGQSPQSMNYQAVARNSNGDILANQVISFRISILKGSSAGTAVYVETQKDTTNQFGLANLKIGAGTVVSGVFSTINWGNDSYFVKIEMDQNGGTSFQLMGVSQLLSVPYSLYSENSGAAEGPWKLNGSNLFYNNGEIGIGTNNPLCHLHVKESTDGKAGIIGERATSTQRFGFISIGGLVLATTNGDITLNPGGLSASNTLSSASPVMRVSSSGRVGIGTSTLTHTLNVNGTIRSKEVIVNTGWSDFVFAKDYKLLSLKELEKYIGKNKHLPDIPSAKEVEENGVALGNISSKLLQKIEELTLYVIDLNKSVEQLKKENASLKKQLKHTKN